MAEEAKDPIESTIARVEEYLGDFGGSFSKIDERVYYAKKGSTLISIRVFPWLKDAVVHVSANVVRGAELSQELLLKLLNWNHDNFFGSFGVSSGGMITIHHTLLGSTMDKDELIPAVLAIAQTADDWDDKIVELAGGKTALDTLREEASKTEE